MPVSGALGRIRATCPVARIGRASPSAHPVGRQPNRGPPQRAFARLVAAPCAAAPTPAPPGRSCPAPAPPRATVATLPASRAPPSPRSRRRRRPPSPRSRRHRGPPCPPCRRRRGPRPDAPGVAARRPVRASRPGDPPMLPAPAGARAATPHGTAAPESPPAAAPPVSPPNVAAAAVGRSFAGALSGRPGASPGPRCSAGRLATAHPTVRACRGTRSDTQLIRCASCDSSSSAARCSSGVTWRRRRSPAATR